MQGTWGTRGVDTVGQDRSTRVAHASAAVCLHLIMLEWGSIAPAASGAQPMPKDYTEPTSTSLPRL